MNSIFYPIERAVGKWARAVIAFVTGSFDRQIKGVLKFEDRLVKFVAQKEELAENTMEGVVRSFEREASLIATEAEHRAKLMEDLVTHNNEAEKARKIISAVEKLLS